MIPNAVLISFGAGAVTGVKIAGNFLNGLNGNLFREKSIQSSLNLAKLAIGRGFEIHDLMSGVNSGIGTPARGRDFCFPIKDFRERLLENFLNRDMFRLPLKTEKSGAVIFEDEFDIAHRKITSNQKADSKFTGQDHSA